LPVYEEIDWVQYSSYANGTFTVEWRDDFDTAVFDPRWAFGTWDSPKALSTHDPRNVGIVDGHAIIALTSDEGVGMGVPPQPAAGGMGGAGGAGLAGSAGSTSGGAGNTGGAATGGAAGSISGGAGGAGGAAAAGAPGASGLGSGGVTSGGPAAAPGGTPSRRSSCATTPGLPNGSSAWLLVLALGAVAGRRWRRTPRG
jgi:hypothetical protein